MANPSPKSYRVRLPNVWAISTFAIALLVALPVIVILAHVFFPSGEVWQHLASTVLGRYLSNTVVLSEALLWVPRLSVRLVPGWW